MNTNSLINDIMGRSRLRTATRVGDGATRLMWSDRHACTVRSIKYNYKSVECELLVTEDIAARVDKNGMSDMQNYDYMTDTTVARKHWMSFTKRKDGSWVRKGEPLKGGERLVVGVRDSYHDFSF